MVYFAGWRCGDVWRFSELIGEHLDEPNASARAGYWCGSGRLGAIAIYLLCILRAGDIWSLLLWGLTCHSNGLLLVTEKVFLNLI